MSGNSSNGTRSRWRFAVEAAWVLLVLAIAGGLCLIRYDDPRRIAISGDSYWYMRQAQMFAGVSEPEASAAASRQLCRDLNRSAADRALDDRSIVLPACVEYSMAGISPRYVAIFDNRPAYPLVASVFVSAFGPWTAMMIATMLFALLSAVLAYMAVWLATGLRLAGVIGSALLFALPSGFWMTRMLVEGAMMFGYLAVLIGAMLLWRRRMVGLPLVVVALAWLFATRSASGAAAAISLVGASLLALFFRGRDRRGPLITGGLATVTLAGWFAASAAYGLPGLNETIQDFATRHFRLPDISDPLPWLWRKNLEYWPIEGRRLLDAPWQILAGLLAAVILFRRARHIALLWMILGVTGLMLMLAHPANGEYPRMMIPLWLPIAAAAGYALALALRGPGLAAAMPVRARPGKGRPEEVAPKPEAGPTGDASDEAGMTEAPATDAAVAAPADEAAVGAASEGETKAREVPAAKAEPAVADGASAGR